VLGVDAGGHLPQDLAARQIDGGEPAPRRAVAGDAVDLARGEILWKVPAGVDAEHAYFGYGPVLVTGGGLVFHSGTRDRLLRVHDSRSGDLLAANELPAGLHAGPITYKLRPDGKQFLVVAPGGHVGLGSTLGDAVIAFTTP